MTEYLTIVGIAFATQIAVLPGEKVQFIIAGLSTRYAPLIVVGAATAAFAGWTVVEILVGEALRTTLPTTALDAITAGLFLTFAVMLYRSAPSSGNPPSPEPDGGTDVLEPEDVSLPWLDVELPGRLEHFLAIFGLMAAGEVGDKTQLVTIGLALEYGATSAIWVGEMLAIVPISIANAVLFHRFAHRFDVRKAHLAGAAVFAFFGLDTLLALTTGLALGESVSVWETLVRAISEAVVGLAA